MIYLFFLIAFSSAKAQVSYFNELNPSIKDSNSWLFSYFDVLEVGNEFYCLGSKITSTTRLLVFTKLNNQGDTIWNKEIGQAPNLYNPAKFVRMGDYFYIACFIQDSAVDNELRDFALIKINDQADVIWQQRYVIPGQDVPCQIISTPDSGFILAGTTGSFGDVNGDFYLIKTDSLGNMEWNHSYGTPNIDVAFSVILTPDGGYTISGGTYVPPLFGNYDVLTICVDSLGSLIWQKQFGSNYNDYGGFMSVCNDDSYLLIRDEVGNTSTVVHVIKLNPDGTVIWSKELTDGNYLSIESDPLVLGDGTIIIAGNKRNNLNHLTGILLKLNPDGSEIWRREYFTNNSMPNYIYGVKATSDNGLVFCGGACDTINVGRAWVVKLDCFGCDSTLCYYPDSVCDFYDCTQFPITADFVVSDYSINLAYGEDTVSFVNNSLNTTNRVWDFGNDSIAYTDSVFTQVYNTVGTYDVSLIVYHGMCSDTLVQTITVVDDLGLTEWEREWERVLIYPNPNNGSFTISNHTNKAFEIEVTDALGKLVYKQKLEESDELIQTVLTNGVYLVKFIHPDKVFQRKIVIQK